MRGCEEEGAAFLAWHGVLIFCLVGLWVTWECPHICVLGTPGGPGVGDDVHSTVFLAAVVEAKRAPSFSVLYPNVRELPR